MHRNWQGKLCVLMIDSSREVLEEYRGKFARIFSAAGYVPEITVSGAAGDDVLSHDEFESRYYDVVVCDVSLGKDAKDTLGLQVLDSIRHNHPGIFTIAYSRFNLTYNQCSEFYQFSLFVNKQRLPNRGYEAYLVQALREHLRVNAHAYIANDGSPLWEGCLLRHVLDLNRAVRKLTYTGLHVLLDDDGAAAPHQEAVNKVTLHRMTGGFSGAVVLRVQAQTKSKVRCVQAILKVALTENREAAASLQRELVNYRQYVRWYLPYHWRPELLGATTEGSLSVICYAFVSSDEEPFETLSSMIAKKNCAAIEMAIESIFQPKVQRWYHHRNVEANESLNDFYLRKCFGVNATYTAQTDVFRREVREYTIDSNSFEISGQRCLFPEVALLGEPAGRCQSCLVHGDLNTRNIFISRRGQLRDVTLIDFSETGRGHVFFDFIVFEVSLRLDMSVGDTRALARRIAQEQALNAGQGSDLPFTASIQTLRTYARNNFPNERYDSYFFGLAVYSFSLLNAHNLSPGQVTALSACVCAALMDLGQRGFWAFCSRSDQR